MKVTGILLAAGASRRMGRDKLIISLGGRTVLRRSAEALLNGGVTDIIIAVSDATRQEAEALLREKCTQYEQNFHSSDEIQDKTLEFRQEDSVIYCDVRYVICGEIGIIREIFIK